MKCILEEMNYKRKTSKKTLWRKETRNPRNSMKEWSRMLHGWWKRDILLKKEPIQV